MAACGRAPKLDEPVARRRAVLCAPLPLPTPVPSTLAPALAMAVLAAVNVALMAWLWRFPMAPDPTGQTPHGVSTAPRSWTALHRWIGYAFAAAYVWLLVAMLPRAWTHVEATAVGVAHAALGVLVGVILGAKVWILRRHRRLEPRMPWIGGALAVATWAVVALAVVPLWLVLGAPGGLTPEQAEGRALVGARCLQCHGASVIAGEDGDARDWQRLVGEMQEEAEERGRTPITDAEATRIAAFLAATRAEADDDRDDRRDDDRDDGRGRGRGRGGR